MDYHERAPRAGEPREPWADPDRYPPRDDAPNRATSAPGYDGAPRYDSAPGYDGAPGYGSAPGYEPERQAQGYPPRHPTDASQSRPTHGRPDPSRPFPGQQIPGQQVPGPGQPDQSHSHIPRGYAARTYPPPEPPSPGYRPQPYIEPDYISSDYTESRPGTGTIEPDYAPTGRAYTRERTGQTDQSRSARPGYPTIVSPGGYDGSPAYRTTRDTTGDHDTRRGYGEPQYGEPQHGEIRYADTARHSAAPDRRPELLHGRVEPARTPAIASHTAAGGSMVIAGRTTLVGRTFDDDDRDYPAVLWWTGIWYALPILIYTVWTLTLSGTPRVGCSTTRGTACASPKSDALAAIGHNAFGLIAAIVLSLAAATTLRRISLSWRAISVGLAAAIVGAGLVTMLISLFG